MAFIEDEAGRRIHGHVYAWREHGWSWTSTQHVQYSPFELYPPPLLLLLTERPSKPSFAPSYPRSLLILQCNYRPQSRASPVGNDQTVRMAYKYLESLSKRVQAGSFGSLQLSHSEPEVPQLTPCSHPGIRPTMDLRIGREDQVWKGKSEMRVADNNQHMNKGKRGRGGHGERGKENGALLLHGCRESPCWIDPHKDQQPLPTEQLTDCHQRTFIYDVCMHRWTGSDGRRGAPAATQQRLSTPATTPQRLDIKKRALQRQRRAYLRDRIFWKIDKSSLAQPDYE